MDIFVINESDADNISEDLLNKFKHKTFSNKEKQKEHCLAYLMLDRILREVYKIQNRAIKFTPKPYLENKEKFFSISHSGKFIALAFSDFECGIDIEAIKKRNFKDISKRMGFKIGTLEEFYYDWTKYEAKYKLGEKEENLYQFKFKDYIITAASANNLEGFNIYIQNGEEFSKL